MAIAEKITSQLRLTFYDGEDLLTGKSIYKTKSFNNVKTSSDADQLYAITQVLKALQERTLYTLERIDSSDIRRD